ncbi:MAG: hypothetical protein J2O39_04520 [Acidimicrobiales bacterium]|nr:hypothetical protein [Acidimicrobiales bacterium]MBO0893622.1 hypothetical protein [Acidimicrobiales bacterium]
MEAGSASIISANPGSLQGTASQLEGLAGELAGLASIANAIGQVGGGTPMTCLALVGLSEAWGGGLQQAAAGVRSLACFANVTAVCFTLVGG